MVTKNNFFQDTLVRWLASENSVENSLPVYSFSSEMNVVRLTDYQRQQMKHDPVLLLNYAQKVIKPAMEKKGSNFTITIDAWKSVNNR